jgi:hypothetical protein
MKGYAQCAILSRRERQKMTIILSETKLHMEPNFHS